MKPKYLFILLFVVVALILTGCSNNPVKTAENFEKIIEEKDAKALFEAVEKEEGLIWTEKNAKETIDYLNENKDEKRSLINALKDQALSLKEKLKLYNDDGMFYFDEEGNIHVRSYELSIDNYYENLKDFAVEVSGEKFDVKDLANEEFTFGIFGPGLYEVAATASYDYAEIKDEKEVSLFDSSSFTSYVDLDLEGEYVYLYTNYPNTKLKINGELTDITFEDSIDLGPVSADTKIQAVVSFPWGDSESKEYIAGENSDIEVSVSILGNEEVKKELTSLLNDFAQDYVAAYTGLDSNKLRNASDDYKAAIHDDIKFAKDYEYTYKGEVYGVRIDFSKVDYSIEGGERYYIEVPIEVNRSFDRFSSFDKDDKPSESYDGQLVTLRYLGEEKAWLIEESGSYYRFGDNSNPDEIVKTEFKQEDKKDKEDSKDKEDNKDEEKKDKK